MNKMNKYKFDNGVIYEYGEQGRDDCRGCVFQNNSQGCIESQRYLDCSEKDNIWLEVKEEPMKSITQEIQDWKATDQATDQAAVQQPGTKYDQGKLQYTLVPPYALQEVARNLTEGLKKYKERNNWQKVEGAEQRYMDALMRHFEAIRRGEIYDVDSSDPTISHMSAVAVNAMFLLEFMYNPELNKKENK
jgi:hypothetical protein